MLLAVIAGVLGIGALDLASGIAVPTVLAILAAIALAPLARRIESIGIPASLAAAVIVAGIVFSTAFAIYALLPSAEAWNARAPHVIRDIEQRVRDINISITDAISITPEAAPVPSPPQTDGQSPPPDADAENPAAGDALGRLVDGGQKMAADWAISAPGIVAAAVYWAVLTFFMLRDRGMLGRRVMALGGRVSSMRALGRAIQDVQNDVASYLLAITLINIALGCGVAAAFYLFGMPNAALWGVAATLLNFMPFIGAAIMAIVTLSVGLVSFADPINAFFLLGVVVILNSIEAQIATPMIVGARIRLPAIGIFVAIAFGAWLWGAVGALVATPALIVASAFVTRLTVLRHGGLEPLGASAPPDPNLP
ncbi:MAG: AI-2E family transporter [Gemmobacter sp.]